MQISVPSRDRARAFARSNAKAILVLAVLAAGGGAYWHWGMAAKPAGKGERGPAPVIVAEAGRADMAVTLETIGAVEAYTSVAIKSRVDGQVVAVHFREGQAVKRGAPLFTIDRRPFEAALAQAEANLARDRAQFEKARLDFARYQELAGRGVASKQQLETARAAADGAAATVKADEAAVERARLDLSYTAIAAPVDGRTGAVLVQQGNVVKANDANPLVVLNQVQPISVAFAVPERNLPQVKAGMAKGAMTVAIAAPGDAAGALKGKLDFVDNSVDAATGMIRLKASLPNEGERLTPGQSVSVTLTLSTLAEAVTVPSAAVLTGPKGAYVYVVKEDMTVEHRPIAAGVARDGVTVVEKGVAPGEKVVTEGQLRLFPGAKVKLPS